MTGGSDWDAVSVSIHMDYDLRIEQPLVALAVFRIAFACAHNYVGYYAAVNDGSIHVHSDQGMARMIGVSTGQWRKIKSDVLKYFVVHNDKIRCPEKWINAPNAKATRARPAMPPALRVKVGERDAWTCGYCGSKEGPFDVDHVVPISLGGAFDDQDNLLLACAPCNRSKGAKMVAEWIS